MPDIKIRGTRLAVGLALLLALIGGPAPAASALPSPNKFLLADDQITVLRSSDQAQFRGWATLNLNTSNSNDDTVKIRVGGRLEEHGGGCARLRVTYLDADGYAIASEHSDPVENGAIDVYEFSVNQAYRNVRLTVLHDTACTEISLTDWDDAIGQEDSDFGVTFGPLGTWPNVRVEVVSESAEIHFSSATAEDIDVRWDVLAAPVLNRDMGEVEITARVHYYNDFSFGCAQLIAYPQDTVGNAITILKHGEDDDGPNDGVCSDTPTPVTLGSVPRPNVHSVQLVVKSTSFDWFGNPTVVYSDGVEIELD